MARSSVDDRRAGEKLGDTLGTYAVISDRREEYVNAIGVSQLILTWSCLEKLQHLMGYRR